MVLRNGLLMGRYITAFILFLANDELMLMTSGTSTVPHRELMFSAIFWLDSALDAHSGLIRINFQICLFETFEEIEDSEAYLGPCCNVEA